MDLSAMIFAAGFDSSRNIFLGKKLKDSKTYFDFEDILRHFETF